MERFEQFRAYAHNHRQSLKLLLTGSGIIGVASGIATANWQAPIEAAQVMAGFVSYDPASPVYAMHMTLFTVVNYFLMLLLYLTNSEIIASVVLCAVIGMIAMQVLAAMIFLGARNTYLSIFAAVVAAIIHLFGYGIAYPVIFMGTTHANGRIGLFFAIAAILFLAFSRFRTGFFLCGLALLVHPSWGAWIGLCLFLVLITGFRYLKPLITRQNVLAYAAGVGVSVVMMGIHRILYPIAVEATADPAAGRHVFVNYIRYFDYHRMRFDNPRWLGRELTYAAVALIVALYAWSRKSESLGEKLFFHFLAVTSVASVVFVFVPSWFAPESMPAWLISLMPGRFINISVFVALPLLLGYVLRDRNTITALGAVGVIWAGLYILSRYSPIHPPVGERELSLLAMAALLLVASRYLDAAVRPFPSPETTSALLAMGALSIVVLSPVYTWKELPRVRSNFARIELPEGIRGKVLVTHDQYLLQAQSRVPTYTPLLDGFAHPGGDILSRVNREMSEIYGVSLSQDPPVAKEFHRGMIQANDYAKTWEERDCTEWARLAAKYELGLVLTPPDIKLRLPRADSDPKYNKYWPRCPSAAGI